MLKLQYESQKSVVSNMTNKEKIIGFAKQNNGVVTSDFANKNAISREYFSLLVNSGELEKLVRGIYVLPGTYVDEMFILQSQHKLAVFSYETALYLHKMSNRTPLKLTVTLPRDYRATKLINDDIVTVARCNREVHQLGVVEMLSPSGQVIMVCDLERTICDIVRNSEFVEKDIANSAIKSYAQKPNITKLMKYAKQLKVEKELKRILEVLL